MSITNVYEAIVEVRKKVPYIQKRRSPAGGINYSYADIETLLAAIKPAMDDAGIVVQPVGSEIISQELFESRSGAKMHRVLTRVRYVFVHAASSTKTDPVEVIGEADDSGDKAVPKTFTLALKQALRQTFLIETGDMDPDNHPGVQRANGIVPDSRAYAAAAVALSGAKDADNLANVWRTIEKQRTADMLDDAEVDRLKQVGAARREALNKAGEKPHGNGSGAVSPGNSARKAVTR